MVIFHSVEDSSDCTNLNIDVSAMMAIVERNMEVWKELSHPGQVNESTPSNQTVKFENLNSVVDWLSRGRDPKVGKSSSDYAPEIDDDVHVQVLVTGSLYLVAGMFTALREAV